jgi:hypothetical protein
VTGISFGFFFYLCWVPKPSSHGIEFLSLITFTGQNTDHFCSRCSGSSCSIV